MKKVSYQDDWPDSWKLSHGYDRQEIWNEIESLGYAYAFANRFAITLKYIERNVRPGSRILDVAAAQGNFSLALAEKGYHVTWNDLRGELADYVRLKYETGLLEFAPGNVFDLPQDEPYNCVLITEIIEHVAHPDEFLQKIGNLVYPGGHVVMTTPNGAYFVNELPRFSDCPNPEYFEKDQFKPNSDGHIFLLWPDEINDLATKSGLELESLELFTSPLLNGHIKLHHLLPYIPTRVVKFINTCIERLPQPIARKVLVHSIACFRKSN